jgi:hypothetical protein
MLLDISNTFLDKSVPDEAIKNYSPDFKNDSSIDFENIDFSSKQEEINFVNEKTRSDTFLQPMNIYDHFSSIHEEEDIIEERKDFIPFNLDSLIENKIERRHYFQVVYPERDSSFTKTDNISILIKEEGEEKTFLGIKKLQNEKTRKDNQDNMRKKIKRGFFNTFLIKFLNKVLKSIGSHKYFEKFPHNFINDVHQKRNKEIFEMTLEGIFMKEALYLHEKKNGFNNYLRNLDVLKSEEVKENEEIKKTLNKSIRKFYEEYINSVEFKIDEINRLRKKEMNDDYIKRYIYLANHFIEFLLQ